MKHGFSLIGLLVVTALLGAGAYVLKLRSDSAILQANQLKLEEAVSSQKTLIENQKKDFNEILEANKKINQLVTNLKKDLDELDKRFNKNDRDIGKLAKERPAVIERVINKGTDSDGTRISSTDIEREQKAQKLENTPSQLSFAESKFAGAYASLLLNRIKGDTDEGKGDTTNFILNFNDGASLKGYGGTLKVGKNIIFNKNLVGLEFGASFQDINDKSIKNVSYTEVATGDTFTETYPIAVKTNVKNYETLAVRLGHIFKDQTLFYLSGGAAVGLVKRTMYQPNGANWWVLGGSDSKSNWETGYTLGLGIEHKIKDNLSLRVNYEYVDFGNVRHSYQSQSPDDGSTVIINQAADIKLSSLGVGLTYSF